MVSRSAQIVRRTDYKWRSSMPYNDKTLTCSDCGNSFTFTAGEQEFHQSKGFTNEPRRCPNCRGARRAEGGGGGGGFGGGGGGYGARREMFTVTCSSCGKDAQVPFQPRGDRPVYCNDCFKPQARSDSGGYGGGSGRGGRW
jgi:CxxC-x17-CxxC domain-containing protein